MLSSITYAASIMTYVEVYTNCKIDKLDQKIKEIVSEGTGKQEMSIFCKVCEMKIMKFGNFDSALLINICSTSPPDEYREKKLMAYVVNKLYYKYGVSK